MKYIPVIGLEVHAELNTKTKIYCGCANKFGSEVNTNCCPICSGMPGTLPVLNKNVVEYAARMGLATNCKINTVTKQDRKNYFYPDLPKAYQISQFDIPLCEHGYLDIHVSGGKKRIGITRIHIEEDAGKLLHEEAFNGTLVDYNRCGVPLIEIVSEPDIRSSEEAKAYLDSLKAILQYLNISDCKMQEGSIRCDVNVSVMPEGATEFGKRVEMKNVNTFSGAVRGIEYEIERQIDVIESGGTVEQETRKWDDMKGYSITMRSKEDAQDYRYFPEPDLGRIELSDEQMERLKASIPELPHAKFERFLNDYGLSEYEADLLVGNIARAAFFEETVKAGKGIEPKVICNWLLGDISRLLNAENIEIDECKLTPSRVIDMINLIQKGTISNTAAKTVLEEMFATGGTADEIVKAKGLAQLSDTSALEAIVDSVLAANEKSVNDYKNGKSNAMGFLVGQCMRASKGQGNPQIISKLLKEKLD
ncbi:MAG: Asp-tRNA(Asn)/Glu-tRNA(Gln) amidotransferase subunit GatB [Bacillota bacterium]|nr:Asp-tRNA(Asn)/Glu-tRNA(Gln) amidotransferase subunit GatB [Bacillota bacterium]